MPYQQMFHVSGSLLCSCISGFLRMHHSAQHLCRLRFGALFERGVKALCSRIVTCGVCAGWDCWLDWAGPVELLTSNLVNA